jgi:KipI family sensor histidine kinase inhibitor
VSGRPPRLLPYGPSAWLVELAADEVVGFAAAVRRADEPAVAEVVPAARTVLVRLREPAERDRVGDWLVALTPERQVDEPVGDVVEIAVVYDGPDLDAVARATGLSTDDVVERHRAGRYVCAFCGFAPGFGYLTGLDPALHVPRRATPRTRVPAGSVAIAAEYTAVYPSVSPGGWHLIGRTDAALWDPGRAEPSLIRPGAIVRFAE